MVRCAMCDSPAEISYSIRGYGELDVCGLHYDILLHNDKCKRNEYENKFREILIKIIHELNKKLAKVPLDKTPGQIQYNRGMRNAFKLSVEPVEKELERLIKE